MKYNYYLALMFIFLLPTCRTTQQINSEEIFRHIDLGLYGRIELDANIANFDSLIEKKQSHNYLKKGIFGGANSIELLTDKEGKIISMIFLYNNENDLAEKISEYEYLGKPKIKNETAIWDDGNTLFEIYILDGGLYSKLSDSRK